MSTRYFLLTKPTDNEIGDDKNNNIQQTPNNHTVYLLPETNLDYYKTNGLFEMYIVTGKQIGRAHV